MVAIPLLVLAALLRHYWKVTGSVLEAALYGLVSWSFATVIILESLSLAGAIDRIAVAAAWVAVGIFVVAAPRWMIPVEREATEAGEPLAAAHWVALGLIAGLAAIVWVTALVGTSNNYDSMVYHLSRVEFWRQQGSLAHYPTVTLRQLYMSPFAEFMILNLQVVSGTRVFANVPQALTFTGCLFAIALTARRLSANKWECILAAGYFATLPMAFIQASGTQNDLVVAFFIVAAVERVLAWRRIPSYRNGLWVGLTLGLAVLTKGTAYFYLGPAVILVAVLVLWDRSARRLGSAAVAAVLTAGVNTPFVMRNIAVFGNSFGPRDVVMNESFGPAALASVAVRNIVSNFATPDAKVNEWIVQKLTGLHRLAGMDLNDPATTFLGNPFQLSVYINNEDLAPNPVHTLLFIVVVLSWAAAAARAWSKRRASVAGDADLPLYMLLTLSAAFLFCLILKWQPWVTRLHVPFFALAAAPFGIVMTRLAPRRTAAICGVVMASAAFFLVFLNFTRPLIATQIGSYIYTLPRSILTSSRWDVLFANRPDFQVVLGHAIDYISTQNPDKLGLVIGDSMYDYPIFGLVEDRLGKGKVRIEHVCVPDNQTPRSAFQPEVVILYEHPAPDRLDCTNGTFVKERSFQQSSWDTGASGGVHVYRRVTSG